MVAGLVVVLILVATGGSWLGGAVVDSSSTVAAVGGAAGGRELWLSCLCIVLLFVNVICTLRLYSSGCSICLRVRTVYLGL